MDFVAFCQALLCLLYNIVSSYFLLLFGPASAVYPYLRILLPFASYYILLLLRLYLRRLTPWGTSSRGDGLGTEQHRGSEQAGPQQFIPVDVDLQWFHPFLLILQQTQIPQLRQEVQHNLLQHGLPSLWLRRKGFIQSVNQTELRPPDAVLLHRVSAQLGKVHIPVDGINNLIVCPSAA